jgi:uncharacterized oxidoreductase
MQTTGHIALVTGGGSGIGLALARALAAHSNTVVIGGRDQHKLERASTEVPALHTIHLDITDEASTRAALADIAARFGGLTMLVNNAGVAHPYRFSDHPGVAEHVADEVTTNLLGTLRVTRLALPLLQRQPAAAIVTLSSVLAYVAVPNLPVYAATKAALHSFSRSLRAQLHDTPVRVFDVLPPLVDTHLAAPLPGAKIAPEAVADAILDGIAADRYELNIARAKLVARLSRLAPALADRAVQRALQGAAPASPAQPAPR